MNTDYCRCENCTDILAKTRPDVIQSIHESFLAVERGRGRDRSCSAANKLVLAEFDIAERTFELAKAAADVSAGGVQGAHQTSDKTQIRGRPRWGRGRSSSRLGTPIWDAMVYLRLREQAARLIGWGTRAGREGGRRCVRHRDVPGHPAADQVRDQCGFWTR